MSQVVEVGYVKELDIKDIRVLFHKQGDPIEQALLIKRLFDSGKNQYEISDMLEISQPHISKFMKLLELPDDILVRIKSGEITFSAGYLLARLPPEKRKRYSSMEEFTLKDIKKDIKRSKTIEMVEFKEAKYSGLIMALEALKNDPSINNPESILIDTVIDILNRLNMR